MQQVTAAPGYMPQAVGEAAVWLPPLLHATYMGMSDSMCSIQESQSPFPLCQCLFSCGTQDLKWPHERDTFCPITADLRQ